MDVMTNKKQKESVADLEANEDYTDEELFEGSDSESDGDNDGLGWRCLNLSLEAENVTVNRETFMTGKIGFEVACSILTSACYQQMGPPC